MSTISSVVKKDLCHGCGICAAVCPVSAISMVYEEPGIFIPKIDETKCIYCKKCITVCSGKRSFGDCSLLGDITGVWVGHAVDEKVRINGASGGIVSAILLHLLETKAIDAAVICKPDEKNPTRGISFVAITRNDILCCAKSIYVMTEIGTGLKKAINNNTLKKIAVVGLPCQIASLKQAMGIATEIKSKVFLSIGLMCGHNVYHQAALLAIKRQGIQIQDISEFKYRASGWSPWFTDTITKQGKLYKVRWEDSPFAAIWNTMLMVPRRCLLCNDFAAESADIAVGDAWLAEYEGNQEGYSILLAHTHNGAEIVQNLIDSKCLNLKLRDPEVIGRSQYCQLDFKKRTVAARVKILGSYKWLGDKYIGELSVEDYFTEFVNVIRNRISCKLPFMVWNICFIDRVTSRLIKHLLRIILRCYNKFAGNGRIVWRHLVKFDNDILTQQSKIVSGQDTRAKDDKFETI